VSAVFFKISGRDSAASNAEVKIGEKAPINTITIAGKSPTPINIMTNGIHAMGGGNFGASKMKLTTGFFLIFNGKLERRIPKITPITRASDTPENTRHNECSEFINNNNNKSIFINLIASL
jgi:hypothetical protein